MLSEETAALLEKGIARRKAIKAFHDEGERDAKSAASSLIGLRYVGYKGQVFEITDVRYGWDGLLKARGYKVLKTGKRGSKIWDAGALFTTGFMGVQS